MGKSDEKEIKRRGGGQIRERKKLKGGRKVVKRKGKKRLGMEINKKPRAT